MILVAWTAMATPAAACGGFGCDLQQFVPVFQNAERIVFAQDGDTVEMHVQITYQGEADNFAWIVPVPAEPEVFVTSDELFRQLVSALPMFFTLNTSIEGQCTGATAPQAGGRTNTVTVTLADASASSSTVQVLSEKTVGPYETVTLQAESVEGLIGWLTDHGYAFADGAEAAIAPYVGREGATFLALRLQKDKDVGDLTPLGLRYTADRASVPVQLTSVSATPDMRMEVYFFGNTRAVPDSYYHVVVNDAQIDWWNFGTNYADVVTAAANEAGGHAFATDYYGDTPPLSFFDASRWDEAAVRAAPDAVSWWTVAVSAFTALPPELIGVLQDQLGLSESAAQVFSYCPACVGPVAFVNGIDAATDDLVARAVEPMMAAQALIDDHPKLTRLLSSLDAVEMTVDPTFVLNPDLEGTTVSNRRAATQVFECGTGRALAAAPRRLELESGLVLPLPSQDELASLGLTEHEYLERVGVNALKVEQTGASGPATLLTDNTSFITEFFADATASCGCASAAGPAPWSVGALAAVAWFRRRRSPGN